MSALGVRSRASKGLLTLLGDLAGNKQQVAQQLLLALRGLGQLCEAVARLWND
jgi:hypothetical protein